MRTASAKQASRKRRAYRKPSWDNLGGFIVPDNNSEGEHTTQPSGKNTVHRELSLGSLASFIVPDGFSDVETHNHKKQERRLQTLQASVMENPDRTATAESTATPTKIKKSQTTFEKQRMNDKASVKAYVQSSINHNHAEFFLWPVTERWDFIRRERRTKLEERARGNSGTTASLFPDRHDEKGDLERLRKVFASYLVDETENGGEGGVEKQVKRVNYDETSDGDGNEDQDDEEVAASKVKTEERGGYEKNVSMADFRTERDEAVTAGDEEVSEGDIDFRRTWRWVDGKMVIWPLTQDREQAELEFKFMRDASKRLAKQKLREQGFVADEKQQAKECCAQL